MVHKKLIDFNFEYFCNMLSLGLISIGFFCIFYKLLLYSSGLYESHNYLEIAKLSGLFLFPFFLAYGSIVYIFSRHGYFKRLQAHLPACSMTISTFLAKDTPTLCILIPSYKEEIPIIRQSLFSSALQNYPNRRVVLLIDNPPSCPNLEITRNLIFELNELLQIQHNRMLKLESEFQSRLQQNDFSIEAERYHLCNLYLEISKWFENEGQIYLRRDHTDDMFIDLTFNKRACDFRNKADSLTRGKIDINSISLEYKMISSIFRVEISSFERKQYQNFSHASNKSMNLNSYLSLLGKSCKEVVFDEKKTLEECEVEESTHTFQDAKYISVLDADSVLTYDYASRLIFEMEQPYFQSTAVIQTPYSAFPKAPKMLERLAGATTDMQYLVHQGFTHFGATFWVGANALIRKKALDDIVIKKNENGKEISVYIQDRTVIEDTESSIDLTAKGWLLHNYPERLSYSATPPDFGSLLIQRKRWANGGLIILPKLISYFFKKPFKFKILKECFFRFHYLISIPGMIFSSFLTLFSPISLAHFPMEALLLTFPYLFIYTRDLKRSGYSLSDLFGVLSLNMILLPVNFAGVLQSMKQIFFGKHTRFFRTPKVEGFTPVPIIYPLSIFCLLFYVSFKAIEMVNPTDAFIAILLAYGLIILFGIENKIKNSINFFTGKLIDN